LDFVGQNAMLATTADNAKNRTVQKADSILAAYPDFA
jgi:hypothetical protein